MPTVLSALQAAADELGIPQPSAYNSDTNLLAHFYSTNRDLRRTRAFRQQLRNHTITFTANRSSYPLPRDFYAGVRGTQYNQTDSWELVGPVSDSRWNYILYGPGAGISREHWRVFGPDSGQYTDGGQLQIQDTPSDTDTISFDYVSANTIIAKPWTINEVIGSTVYRSANGNIYSASSGTTGSDVSAAPENKADETTSDSVAWTYIATPYTTVQDDADEVLFGEDVTILGIKWRWREAHGLDFARLFSEYEAAKAAEIARWNGTSSTLGDQSVGGKRFRPYVSPGSWSWSG